MGVAPDERGNLYLKILLITTSPVNKTISSGNTFLNLFEGLDQVELSSLYARSGLPDKRISSAFRITEKMILKVKNVGKLVEDRYDGVGVVDNDAVKFVKKKRWTIFFWIQNFIWRLPFWKSKKLKKYLADTNPDVILTILNDSFVVNKLTRFVCKYTKKPLILYAWDDNYSMQTAGKSPLMRYTKLCARFRMRKLASMASKVYVISELQKVDFKNWFDVDATLLTKTADFSVEPELKQSYGSPLQMVFTGNIGMNRWRSLELLVNALKRINEKQVRAELRIYTGSNITEEMQRALNAQGASYLMGSIPATQVADIQSQADILVHVEGLDKKSRIETRQSFSTKLIDYFKMARPILAIGPRGVASIEYLIDKECALVVDNEADLYEKLVQMLSNYEMLDALAKSSYDCGRQNHDVNVKNSIILKDFTAVIKGNLGD